MKKERKKAEACSFKSLLGDPGIGEPILRIAHALTPQGGELWACSPAIDGVQRCEIPNELGLEEGYKAFLCPGHEKMIAYITIAYSAEQSASWKPEALTPKEVNGSFLELREFSTDCEKSSHLSSGIWLEVRMLGSSANELSGEQTTRVNEYIRLSCYVVGHSKVNREGEQLAFLYFPCLKVQAEVSVAWLTGAGPEGWQAKPLLTTIRAQPDYKDGKTDTGLSMFMPVRQIPLAERVAAVAKLEEATDMKPFVAKASPATKVATAWDKDWTSYTSENMFELAEKMATDSPGKLSHYQVPLFSSGVQPEPAPVHQDMYTYPEKGILDRCLQSEPTTLCVCGRGIKGDGTAACACGLVFNVADMVKSSIPLARSKTTTEASSEARHAALLKKFEPVYTNFLGTAAQQSQGRATGGGGDDGDPGDDDDEDEGDEGEEPVAHDAREQDVIREAIRVAREALLGVLESERYDRLQRKNASETGKVQQQANASLLGQTLQAHSHMLAVALTEHHNFLLERERSAQQFAERAAREAAAEAALLEVKTKEAAKFPLGCIQLVQSLQSAGRHGDMTGSGAVGVFKQLGVNVITMAGLYRAIVAASVTPDTAQAFTFQVTQQLVYNLVTGNVGAAPLPNKVEVTFNSGAGLHDWKRDVERRLSLGTVSYSTEIPTKKTIKFVSDKERSAQQFGDIYELEEAFGNYATMMAMVFGPVWFAPIKDCGRRLRELHFSDPQKYHMKLIAYLADLGLRHSWQMSEQLASNPEFIPSQEQRNLSQRLGFATQAFIPGDGFLAGGAWMRHNVIEPFEDDVRAMLRVTMGRCSLLEKQENRFSATPHFFMPQRIGASRQVRVGWEDEAETLSEEMSEELGGEHVNNERQQAGQQIVQSRYGDWQQSRYDDWQQLGGQATATTQVSSAGRGKTKSKGDSSGSRDGKGGRGAAAQPSQLVRMARHHVQEGFGQLPNTKGPDGAPAGIACLRALCRPAKDKQGAKIPGLVNNCPAGQSAHPLNRPGGVCGKSHFPVDGVLSWLVRALSLSLGGLRCEPPPPTDPVKLQELCDKYVDNAVKQVPLPTLASTPRQTTLGWTGPHDEVVISAYAPSDGGSSDEDYSYVGGGYIYGDAGEGWWEHERLGDGAASSDPMVTWQVVPRNQLPPSCLRVGELTIPHLPYRFLVFDLGGRCPNGARAGNKNCLLSTLGALFQKYGYDLLGYLESAQSEFGRSGVADRPEYSTYAALLRGTDFLLLHMVVHMGVPEGVALVIVCSRPGVAAQLVVFTCGNPKVVEFAVISKKHIMPMAHVLTPFRPATWADFSGALESFKSHGGHVVIKHTSRALPMLVNASFGHVAGSTGVLEVGCDEEEAEELKELMTRELGMTGLDQEEEAACDELMSSLVLEIQEFMTALRQGSKGDVAAATAWQLLDRISQTDDEVWERCPSLLNYYALRLKLCGYTAQECDLGTVRFLDKLWERSAKDYPFPHFYRSVVAQLIEGAEGGVAVGIFMALAKDRLSAFDAAAMVALNLHGEAGPSTQVKQYLSEYLVGRYEELAASCGEETRMNLWCRSLDEFRERVERGQAQNQSKWLDKFVSEYSEYIEEQEGRPDFFSVGTVCAIGAHSSLQTQKRKYKRLLAKRSRGDDEEGGGAPAGAAARSNSPARRQARRSIGRSELGSRAESESAQSEANMAESLKQAEDFNRTKKPKNPSGLKGHTGYALLNKAERKAAEEAAKKPKLWRTQDQFAELRYVQREPPLAEALRSVRATQADRLEREARVEGRTRVTREVIDLTDDENEAEQPSRSQSKASVLVMPDIPETVEDVTAFAIAEWVSPNTLEQEVERSAEQAKLSERTPQSLAKAGNSGGASLRVTRTSVEDTESEEEAVKKDEFESPEVMVMLPRQVAGSGLVAGALIGPSATPEAETVDLEEKRQNLSGTNAPTIEAAPGVRVLTDEEAQRGCIFPSDGQLRYKRGVTKEHGMLWTWSPISYWAWRSVKSSVAAKTARSLARSAVRRIRREPASSITKRVRFNGCARWAVRRVQPSNRSRCWPAWKKVVLQRMIETVPANHEQSQFLQALGEEVSNNRNKGSAVKGKRELDATAGQGDVRDGREGRRTLTRVEQALDTSQSCAEEAEVSDERENAAYENSEAEERKAEEQQAQRNVTEAEVVAAMLQDGSPEILSLQPLVRRLQQAIAELKAAIVNTEPAGERKRKSLQDAYLKASNKLCHAAERACNNRWWPQLFVAAYRATHPGRVNPNVDPEHLRQVFEGLISPEVLRVIVAQAREGQEIYLSRSPESSWPRETPTAKMYADEIWRTIWIDAAHESTFVFGPECIPAMNKAQIQGYPLHRIPKKNTSTGEATTKGRLIADLSATNAEGHSINSTTLLDHYPKFRMPGHPDVARDVMILRQWFPKMRILISKLDVARAFRKKLLSVGSFGVLAFRLSGHTGLDQAFVFGLGASPSVYASTSQAIHEAHNACGVHFTGDELRDYGYAGYDQLSDSEKRDGMRLPFFSHTYCDDGILVAIDAPKYMEATMSSYKHFMIAALGPDAVSDKDPEEQEWSQVKTVIGHRFSLGEVPDARGCVDFLCPTPQRIALMTLVMSDIQFTPHGKDSLTAGLCAKAFSLWLWMCIPCSRLKAFIGSFKRVFEGKQQWTATDVVTPVRKGDDPTVAWQLFWDDMLTLKTILLHHEQKPAFFKVPLFRLLREEEQLMMFRSWFTTIATDASMLGGGGFCYEGQYAGHFFRVPFPAWVIRDIRESMKKGHGDEGSWRYTIAVAEKAMHTLGLILYGEPGGCCAMLQDNQNVVDWVLKGWGKPTRVQNYLRWDVMVAQSRDMWAAIEYIHTSLNIHADPLSRSFNEDGSDKLEVLAEFHDKVRALGLVATETRVPDCLLRELLPEEVEACDLAKLERYASESWGLEQRTDNKAKTEELDNQTVGRVGYTESAELTAAKCCSQWRSPQDEGDDDALMRMLLGGRTITKKPTDGLTTVNSKRKEEAKLRVSEVSEVRDEEFEVEKVLKKRVHPVFGAQYKVNWIGHSHIHNRWMSEGDLENSSEVITEFEVLQKEKGMLKADATDREAEKFYYGSAHRVSAGPGTVPWVRSSQITKESQESRKETPLEESEHRRVPNPVFQPMQEPYRKSVFRDDVVPKKVSTTTEAAQVRRLGVSHPDVQSDILDRCLRSDRVQTCLCGRSVTSDGASACACGLATNVSRQEPVRQLAGKGGKGVKGGKATGEAGRSGEQGQHQASGRGVGLTDRYRGFLGPSLADKVEQASLRTGRRRLEVYIEPNDDRLRKVAALTLAHSLAKNTRRTYDGNFRFFLDFCERQQLSPILDGSDKRGEEARLIEYVMYEYEIHGNKYSTLKLKLSAIRSAMMDEGYANPLENKTTLARHMRGIKALRGATDAKEPLPAEAFKHILTQTDGAPLFARATGLAIAIAFFFLLRIGEFAARDKNHMDESILLRQDVTFFCQGKLCAWHHPEIDAVELFIRGSKTDQRKQGCRRMQYRSNDATLCPVKCMVEWFALTEGSCIPASAPLFSVPKGQEGVEWSVLTREAVTMLMKGAAVDFDLQPKWVATHSIRISGATALLMAGVPPETVQIMGRWVSNAFIGYTRYQAELMAGISERMVRTHYVVRPQ